MKNFLTTLGITILLVISIMTPCAAITPKVNGELPKGTYSSIQRTGNTFEAISQTDTKTPYTWKDKDGKIYPIYISMKRISIFKNDTSKGPFYIKRISKKTGKEYKYYLPKEVQDQIRKEIGL